MYLDFRVYTNSEGEIATDLLQKINTLCPDIDTSTGGSNPDEDEKGESNEFWYGEDTFYAEDGTTELEGDELEEAEKSNEAEVLQMYLSLLPLQKAGEIISLWISDGSQFGWWPTKEAAEKRLAELQENDEQ